MLFLVNCRPLINTNGDAEIQVSEATAYNGNIELTYGSLPSSFTTSDLTGIEAFVNLKGLQLGQLSQLITSIDLSSMIALETFGMENMAVSTLDVSNNTALTYLACSENALTSLDVSNNTALDTLYCRDNQLTSLDVSQNTALTYLSCDNNQLTSLDVSANTALIYLTCWQNQLTTLNVSQNTALTILGCSYNQLTCLDVSNNTALTYLSCGNNLLEQLNTKNGNWVNGITIAATTNNLTCVEVDNLGYANSNWISSFDNFVTFSTNCNYTNPCNTTSAIQEHTINKELLRTIDILGRETKNNPLFYIYDDGTVEKRIVIE